ncbi:MAG: hypothetical protein WAM28_08605 [Chlamydiales bacterium]
MAQIQLYDPSTIDQINWDNFSDGPLAKSYLLPLIKEGPESFIQNAKTQMFVLTIGNHIIPISVNDAEYKNCYLLSSYFVVENLKEKLENTSSLIKWLSIPLVSLLGGFLKLLKINKVVIINNWLFTTNLYPELSQEEINSMLSFLKKRFPDHYFMFRSVNTYKSAATYDALNLERFRMIPCRQIYLYDPSRSSMLAPRMLRKQKKDANRLANKKYEVEEVDSLSDEEMVHLLELYQKIYVGKYTRFSPIYTKKFLQHVLKNKIYLLKILKKEGRIYGVTGFLQKNNYIFVPFFGYDTSIPQEEGLYRMLSSVILSEIERVNLVSHQGSGGGQFKKWRGFVEHPEYVAIYDRHLNVLRRSFWFCAHVAQKLSKKSRDINSPSNSS